MKREKQKILGYILVTISIVVLMVIFLPDKVDKLIVIITNQEEERQEAMEIQQMMSQFDIVYVPNSEEEKGHQIMLAPTEKTQLKIDAFNEYMQSGSGKQYAEDIGYTELPEKELTFDYISENPGEVAELIWSWKNCKMNDLGADLELEEIYMELKNEGMDE